jgi:hypothetical protein
MPNVVDFILGYLFGVYSENKNRRMCEDEIKNSNYVPRFNGYLRNEGTRYDEDWKWIEPKYRTRYLNIYISGTEVRLRGNWIEDKSADECMTCRNQMELETEVNIQNRIEFEKEVVYETKDKLVYLNVELNEDITIFIDKFKKEDCFESISCLDLEEAEELIEVMKDHYRQYRYVDTIDNVNA